MKKLILLATLFLLTSCDAITGTKPKPSATATPLASESPDPNAPIASGTPGAETPGPTTNSPPSPSQMPTNSVAAGNSAVPSTASTNSVAGNAPLNPGVSQVSANPGVNQASANGVSTLNSVTEPTNPTSKVGKKPLSRPSEIAPDQNSITAFNGNSANTKDNSKDSKTKNGQGVKGAKGVDESLEQFSSAINPTGAPAQKTITPQTIADGGIGAAKVGMTLAELKKSLKNTARFETQTNFAPGYNAVAVKQQGKVQFYIPYPKNQQITGNEQVKFLVTDNPLYKTAEGVSPGMSIKKASAIYGTAQLAFNPKAKVEEIVAFANQPGDLRFFSSGPESNGRAGIYPKKTQEQGFVTEKFSESGKIKRITVVCSESVCPPNQP